MLLTHTAIVILNYNGEKLLPQFLPSVIRYASGARVIVADNASTDRSREILQKQFPTVEVIALDKNYGFCGGYNRALQQVDASYYVLLNSDVEVTEGWLPPLVSQLETDHTVAAVQPRILAWHQKDHFEYAGAGGGFVDMLGYPFCRGRLFEYTEPDTGQYNDTREVFWASGACMLVRASVYRDTGGLDEDFFAHMEEIDLCWRIHRSGAKVRYCGTSVVYHVGAGTLSKTNPRKTYLNFRNGLTLLMKNLSTAALCVRLPLRLGLDYVAAIRFLLSGQFAHAVAILKAHRDFIKTLPRTLEKRKSLGRYPYTNHLLHSGLVIVDHYLLGKKRIRIR